MVWGKLKILAKMIVVADRARAWSVIEDLNRVSYSCRGFFLKLAGLQAYRWDRRGRQIE